jgi:hypothetical protein
MKKLLFALFFLLIATASLAIQPSGLSFSDQAGPDTSGYCPVESVSATSSSPFASWTGTASSSSAGNTDNFRWVGQFAYVPPSIKNLGRADWYIKTIHGDVSGKTYYAEVWYEYDGDGNGVMGSLICRSNPVTGISTVGWKEFDFPHNCTLFYAVGGDPDKYGVYFRSPDSDGTNYVDLNFTTDTTTAIAASCDLAANHCTGYSYDASVQFYSRTP